ncbi:hypothetical protein HSACCH_01250 [Halanaerobium saccharolyticum subsp. saccharolyticum DSM 6643]|jgi:uncharacterized membrane protein|uniref:Small integral membrane protein DUF2273 n=1 Tax=Halanaerobium saccharolyticum subsp. saccharolyticum DSM 6643 TaxID=1293054 RepID=M5EE28_9FIRM|nr:DUF2273 domain-containing protein [Halanaerobium saccharolyticum]CCU79339.1 hypothetical protein HSACCH_01250 [Halanaerobium saccharolyticum subsp. saccharolyticum DSM 6643]
MDKKEFKEELSQYIYINRKKIIGALIGLIIGILILTIGFFKTLLLFLTTLVGYYLGMRWRFEEDLKDFILRIIPDRFK